jgi:hypothetical protein
MFKFKTIIIFHKIAIPWQFSSPLQPLERKTKISPRNEFAWSQTITIKWSGRVQLSVLVAVARKWQVKWNEVREDEEERREKKLLTTFTKCALVSCLSCINIYGERVRYYYVICLYGERLKEKAMLKYLLDSS